jgi:hypothetical protein
MILDSFYFLFKSDTKDAQKNVDDLSKKIDTLKDKGKKRSEQENKDLKETIKQHKELSGTLKETEFQYVKIAQGVAEAAAGVLSFRAVVKGILGTASSNSALQVQGKLINQNTAELKAFGAAAEQAGGHAEDLYDYANTTFQTFSSLGLGDKLPSITKQIDRLRAQIKGLSLGEATRVLNQIGVSQGLRPLLFLSDSDYEKAITYNRELTKNTEEGAKIARAYAQSWSQVGQAFDSLYTSIGSSALPAMQSLNKEMASFIKYLAEGGIGKDIYDIFNPSSRIENKNINKSDERPITPNDLIDVKKGEKRNSHYIHDSNSQNTTKEFYLTSSEPLENAFPKDAARMSSEYNATIARANQAISLATNSQIGFASPAGAINNNARTLTVKVGDIHINTDSSNSQGIAVNIANDLKSQIYFAISNIDDGVAK